MSLVELTGTAGVPGDGPYMILTLTVQQGVVQGISCRSNGCPTAYTICARIEEIFLGREIERMKLLERQDFQAIMPPVGDGKESYYDLAWDAFRKTIDSVGE